MDLGLRDKPIVIVGGTSGMGFATARILAEGGARIALIGRDPEKAQARAASLRDAGGLVVAFSADGSVPGEVERAIDAAADHFGGLHGLAVTAGPTMKAGSFLDFTDDDWNRYFQSVLMATVRSCAAAIPHMIRGGGGAIVLTSAYSTRGLHPTLLPYIAMKSAVAAMSKNLAKEFGPHAIRVNCVCPGAVMTEAFDRFIPAAIARYGEPAEAAVNKVMIDDWHMDVALGRVGRPAELGDLYAFLLSARAGYMTGAIINQDGGTHFF